MSLGYFIIRRIIFFIPVFILATLIAYGICYLLPGNVAIAILGEHATTERVAELESELGLDRPFLAQYGDWLKGVGSGDWGTSLFRKTPVMDTILSRIPVTLELVLLAKLWSSLVGIALAIVSVLRPNSVFDFIARFISILGQSIPAFLLAMFLILFIGIQWRILPITGFVSLFDDPVAALKYLALPVIAMGAPGMAAVTRQMRSSLLEVLQEDYIKMAFLKGMSRFQVIVKHGLKNSLIPVITVIGTYFITAMGGAVVIENIFVIPGLGQLVVNSINTRDFPMVLGVIVSTVLIVLAVNIIMDIAYKILDPRIEY